MQSSISAITAAPETIQGFVHSAGDAGGQGIIAGTAPNASDASLFASMMQSKDVANVAQLSAPATVTGPSMIEKLAIGQVADLRDLVQSTRDLVSASPTMSMSEMVAAGGEMTLKMTITTTEFSIASAIGKSAGSAFQTLMKNQ